MMPRLRNNALRDSSKGPIRTGAEMSGNHAQNS
jgi:hypothetical protein